MGIVEGDVEVDTRAAARELERAAAQRVGFVVVAMSALEQRTLVPRAEVQLVECPALEHQRLGGVGLSLPSQQRDLQVPRLEMACVESERLVERVEGRGELARACRDRRQGVVGRAAPCPIPGRLREGGASLEVAALKVEAQAEVVEGLAVARVGIAPRQGCDRRAEMALRVGEPTLVQRAEAEGVVAAGIACVAAQRLFPIRRRVARRVSILAEVQPREVQLLGARDGLGRERLACRLRFGRTRPGRERVGQQLLASPSVEREAHGQASPRPHVRNERRIRREIDRALEEQLAVRDEAHRCSRKRFSDRRADAEPAWNLVEAERAVQVRVLRRADALDREPVLLEDARLVRTQPREIGLVVGEHAGHQLDVRAIGVGQLPVPGLAELAAAPGPLLLARRDVVIRHVHETGFAA